MLEYAKIEIYKVPKKKSYEKYKGRIKSSWTYLIRKRDRHRTYTKSRLGVIRSLFRVRRVLTLLLRGGTLWRCGDGLVFEYGESANFSNGLSS
jgi:hypothetical protein